MRQLEGRGVCVGGGGGGEREKEREREYGEGGEWKRGRWRRCLGMNSS